MYEQKIYIFHAIKRKIKFFNFVKTALHAFIAGLALGLTEEKSGFLHFLYFKLYFFFSHIAYSLFVAIVVTFIAIVAHKGTAAAALGISLIKSRVKRGR